MNFGFTNSAVQGYQRVQMKLQGAKRHVTVPTAYRAVDRWTSASGAARTWQASRCCGSRTGGWTSTFAPCAPRTSPRSARRPCRRTRCRRALLALRALLHGHEGLSRGRTGPATHGPAECSTLVDCCRRATCWSAWWPACRPSARRAGGRPCARSTPASCSTSRCAWRVSSTLCDSVVWAHAGGAAAAASSSAVPVGPSKARARVPLPHESSTHVSRCCAGCRRTCRSFGHAMAMWPSTA